MEQRQEERYLAEVPITYAGDLIDGEGTVVNLSASGCGVRTTRKVRDRSYVHLCLYLPQKRTLKIELAAVRWANANSFGLEFIRISKDQRRRLREYVNSLRSEGLATAIAVA